MPKEVVVNAWCDPCYSEGDHTPAEEVTITLADVARSRPQVLLLCERHRKEHYEPLRELLEEFGMTAGMDAPVRPVKSRRSPVRVEYGPFPEGAWECPYPDCDAADLNGKDRVQRHMRQVHGVSLGEFLTSTSTGPATDLQEHWRKEPTKEPTTEMPLRAIPSTGVAMFCPIEDCVQSRNHNGPSKNKNSLSTHFTQRHGIPIGQWFRDHPDVDPESLLVRVEGDTLV